MVIARISMIAELSWRLGSSMTNMFRQNPNAHAPWTLRRGRWYLLLSHGGTKPSGWDRSWVGKIPQKNICGTFQILTYRNILQLISHQKLLACISWIYSSIQVSVQHLPSTLAPSGERILIGQAHLWKWKWFLKKGRRPLPAASKVLSDQQTDRADGTCTTVMIPIFAPCSTPDQLAGLSRQHRHHRWWKDSSVWTAKSPSIVACRHHWMYHT